MRLLIFIITLLLFFPVQAQSEESSCLVSDTQCFLSAMVDIIEQKKYGPDKSMYVGFTEAVELIAIYGDTAVKQRLLKAVESWEEEAVDLSKKHDFTGYKIRLLVFLDDYTGALAIIKSFQQLGDYYSGSGPYFGMRAAYLLTEAGKANDALEFIKDVNSMNWLGKYTHHPHAKHPLRFLVMVFLNQGCPVQAEEAAMLLSKEGFFQNEYDFKDANSLLMRYKAKWGKRVCRSSMKKTPDKKYNKYSDLKIGELKNFSEPSYYSNIDSCEAYEGNFNGQPKGASRRLYCMRGFFFWADRSRRLSIENERQAEEEFNKRYPTVRTKKRTNKILELLGID